MTRLFVGRTMVILLALPLLHWLSLTPAIGRAVGVEVIADFHDGIINSWPDGGVASFKARTRDRLISRLTAAFTPQEFTASDGNSELLLEIRIDPGDLDAAQADYALEINIKRRRQGGKTRNEPFGLRELDWQHEFPSSPENASAKIVTSTIRLLRRRGAELRDQLKAIMGRRLPIAMTITNFTNPGELLSQSRMMIEPLRHVSRAAYESRLDNGLFIDEVELPRVGHSYQANLHMEPLTGNNNGNSGTITKLCLRAAGQLGGGESLVELRCPYGGDCALKNPAEARRWVRQCGPRSGWRWPVLIGAAHAQPSSAKRNIWYAPSLKTLRERRRSGDILGVGYTVFTLQADRLPSLNADAFTYQISVNGTPVQISGMPPKALVQSLDPEFGFELQFGLENHYFRGKQLGCDVIGVELIFLRDGEPVGQPMKLKRPYIALRDADPYLDRNWRYPFTWTGRYKMPRANWEYELFVGEDNFNWIPPEARADIQPAVLEKALRSQRRLEKRMQWNRQWIDKVRIPGPSNTRLVGVLRPPLTIKPGDGVKRLAYGIALGLEDLTSGQVFFTFTKSQRDGHKAFFEAKFAELKSYPGDDPAYRKLKKSVGKFESWLGPPRIWRKYEIGSNDAPTPPGFCESLPAR